MRVLVEADRVGLCGLSCPGRRRASCPSPRTSFFTLIKRAGTPAARILFSCAATPSPPHRLADSASRHADSASHCSSARFCVSIRARGVGAVATTLAAVAIAPATRRASAPPPRPLEGPSVRHVSGPSSGAPSPRPSARSAPSARRRWRRAVRAARPLRSRPARRVARCVRAAAITAPGRRGYGLVCGLLVAQARRVCFDAKSCNSTQAMVPSRARRPPLHRPVEPPSPAVARGGAVSTIGPTARPQARSLASEIALKPAHGYADCALKPLKLPIPHPPTCS